VADDGEYEEEDEGEWGRFPGEEEEEDDDDYGGLGKRKRK